MVATALAAMPPEDRTDWYSLSVDDASLRLYVNPAVGLSEAESPNGRRQSLSTPSDRSTSDGRPSRTRIATPTREPSRARSRVR